MSDANPTPTQALAGIAGQVVDQFKATPALLAIVVLQFAMLGAIVFGVQDARHKQHEEMKYVLTHCLGEK